MYAIALRREVRGFLLSSAYGRCYLVDVNGLVVLSDYQLKADVTCRVYAVVHEYSVGEELVCFVNFDVVCISFTFFYDGYIL